MLATFLSPHVFPEKIDCTATEDLCASEPWQITKYPTIMLRRFGKLYEYDQAREARELVRYMRKATEPVPKVRRERFYIIANPIADSFPSVKEMVVVWYASTKRQGVELLQRHVLP